MANLEYTTNIVNNEDKSLELAISSQGIEIRNPETGRYVDLTFGEFRFIQDHIDKYLGFAEIIKIDIEV